MYNSLRSCLTAWKSIDAPDYVLDWIKQGVPLVFSQEPQPAHFPNRKLSFKESNFVDTEISKLLKNGSIRRCHIKPYVVSPISCVPKKGPPGDDLRLIIDLRYLNEHILCPSFAQEGIDTVSELIGCADLMVTADFEKGFHHVPVNINYQKYLGFYHKGVFYVFQVLCFGLKCSPFYFNKVLRPVVQFLRNNGLRIVLYVDDCLLMSSSSSVTDHCDFMLQTFADLGWRVNIKKSSLQPESQKKYLGFIINSEGPRGQPWISVPNDRIKSLRKDIVRILQYSSVKVRKLARVAGQCVSMTKAILPAKLLLRNIYRTIATRSDWNSEVILDNGTRIDLNWWIAALESWNGQCMVPKQVTLQLVTDASSTGYGGVIDNMEAAGFWNTRLSFKHSNYRELMAVLLCLKAFAPYIKNQVVQVLSDNITTVAYISHLGGPSAELSQLARAVWAEAIDLNVELRAKHLAGVENVHADYLSRLESPYEWRLHPNVFKFMDRLWGPHTCDRFASLMTTQLPVYNSLFYDPLTSGVDALAQQDWAKHNNFVNAPFHLISKILNVIQNQGAEATIVAPWWPAQPWFADLKRMSVAVPVRLRNSTRVMTRMGARPEPWKNKKWKVMVWRVSGKIK